MQHLEVSCAVRRFFKSLGFKGLNTNKAVYWFAVRDIQGVTGGSDQTSGECSLC